MFLKKYGEPQYGQTFLREIDKDLNIEMQIVITKPMIPTGGIKKNRMSDTANNPNSMRKEPKDFFCGLSNPLWQVAHVN